MTSHVAWDASSLATRLRGTGEDILSNVGFRVTGENAVAFGALLVNAAAELERLKLCFSDGSLWIPVSERVPLDTELVLSFDGRHQQVAYYWPYVDNKAGNRNKHWYMWHPQEDEEVAVTHWMPLPEAPK